jgi:hypothetical protein
MVDPPNSEFLDIEKLHRDALRYRWLREHSRADVRHRLTWYLAWDKPLTGKGLDEAIDEQLNAVGKSGE